MAYVQTHTPFTQEGEHVGPDGVSRTVVNLSKAVVDIEDARRLARHFAEQAAQGLPPLVDECREVAVPIMQALVDAGYVAE